MTGVATFYRFTPIADPAAARAALLPALAEAGVRGTVLLAPEGVNGTLAGPASAMAGARAALRRLPGCEGLGWRESAAAAPPFRRLKVRLRPEIVTMGAPGLDPAAAGTRVDPRAWNALLDRPEVAVIDTRNAYETAIGRFRGAVDPGTARFRDFPGWWAGAGARLAGRPVAMYCTGGIRCEKATAWLRAAGVAEVYHLAGGILRYLAETPPGESRWEGACFVFDDRVSVGPDLRPGRHTLCHGCRRPVAPEETRHPDFEAGVSCPACRGATDAARRARLRERQRQVTLAAARGAAHLA